MATGGRRGGDDPGDRARGPPQAFLEASSYAGDDLRAPAPARHSLAGHRGAIQGAGRYRFTGKRVTRACPAWRSKSDLPRASSGAGDGQRGSRRCQGFPPERGGESIMNGMSYKGYIGDLRVDLDAGVLRGKVINTRDTITFQGKTVEEARRAFRDSVDDYLEFCAATGDPPEKPFSGRFVVRVPSRSAPRTRRNRPDQRYEPQHARDAATRHVGQIWESSPGEKARG